MLQHEGFLPPQSRQAEESVLGALLIDNSAFDQVGDLLQPEHFYDPAYRAIYRSVASLIRQRQVADTITVMEAGQHDLPTLNELAHAVPSAAHIRGYAQIVFDRWQERELMRLGSAMVEEAVRPGKAPAEKIDAAMSQLTGLGEKRGHVVESVSLDHATVAFLDWMQAEAEGRTTVMSTGLANLDRILSGGLRAGELMVLGGRPKMGKTALTLTLARGMAAQHGVLLLSQEMPVIELMLRHTASLGCVDLNALRRPKELDSEGWSRMSEAVERMRDLRMILDDQRALTLLDVRRKVMAAKRRGPLGVVIIDYLQLMAGDGDNRNQELDRISNGLKAMAGEFGVAVIVLSQCSREADKRHGPPVMTDLRDSGAIEAAADIIALLYREHAHPLGVKTDENRQHAQLEIVQRNGAPGTINLKWTGEFQLFEDWEGPAPRAGKKRGGREEEGLR
ncbi:replicative DNA helicase [Eleftheria terrae]|uniref:replicative DNA helicase n=1 Tax=Eleftheria terrae TaxID=1597781 RepID=UPI00263A51A6|nr:DnaB-like helicase C-terminal domain-containing protein [Eleftheria terrae]WKB52298.1 AAA family ATPase [Eleftheria terrae]